MGLAITERNKANKIEDEVERKKKLELAQRREDNIQMSETQDSKFAYPCVYLINNKGITYYYSKVKNPNHFVPKVIISMGKFEPVLD